MATRSFASLTLRGRARRLRALALAALPAWPFRVRRMSLLSNSWNCVFRLETDQGRFVLRVTLPGHGHTPASVRAEAVFLSALDGRLGAPAPVPTRNGRLAVSASVPGVPEARMCAVYTWVPGADLGARVTPDRWAGLGELMAQLHDFARTFEPPKPFPIYDYDRVLHFPDEIVVWDAELFGHAPLFREAITASNERIRTIRARDGVLVTHGDLHQWNVKALRGVLRPIDFEDLMWAAPVQDAATSLYYVSRRDDYAQLRDAFPEGYERRAPWVEGCRGEVDSLLFCRGLDLLNIIAGEPAFRTSDWRGFVERIARLARLAVA